MCHPVGCEWPRCANGSAETTAKEGYGVTLGKPLGTTKEAGYGVSWGDL